MMRSLGHVFCATLLACLAQQIVATSRLQVGAEPWFCHELDCPEFRVVETTDAYEVREYEAGKCCIPQKVFV